MKVLVKELHDIMNTNEYIRCNNMLLSDLSWITMDLDLCGKIFDVVPLNTFEHNIKYITKYDSLYIFEGTYIILEIGGYIDTCIINNCWVCYNWFNN